MNLGSISSLHTNTLFSTLKLPDGGAKLKLKLEQIKSLLDASEDNLTNRITDKVSEMSLSEKPNVRKETLLRSNNISDQPSKLLKATTHDGMEQANVSASFKSFFLLYATHRLTL